MPLTDGKAARRIGPLLRIALSLLCGLLFIALAFLAILLPELRLATIPAAVLAACGAVYFSPKPF